MISKYQNLGQMGNNKPARFVAASAVILYFYFILGGMVASIPLIYSIIRKPYSIYDPLLQENAIDFMGKYVNPVANYIFSNLAIYFMLAGAFIAIKWIHNRPFRSVFNNRGRFKWANFCIGFGVFGLLLAIGTGVDYILNPGTYKFSFDSSKFWYTLPLILIMTPIQTTTEEIVFRGYVIQSFGLKIKNGLLLSVISGVIFTLPHLANPEVYASNKLGVFSTVCMILNYFVVGMVLAMITISTNSLEAAMGAHAVNNLFCFILVSYPDTALPTNTVFYTSSFDPVAGLVSVIITAALFYAATTFIIKKTDKTLDGHKHMLN